MDEWEKFEELARMETAEDLRRGAEMGRPILGAWAGDAVRFVAWLRDFAKGEHPEALAELLPLAAALDADRLAFAITGRAWSLDDPIPPVTDDADLRQRVLVLELVDGSVGRPRHRSVLLPFDTDEPGAEPRWGDRRELPGSEGWVGQVLRCAASSRTRRRLRASDRVVAEGVRRCDALGHELHLDVDLAQRIAGSAVPRTPVSGAGRPRAADRACDRRRGRRPRSTGRRR